MLDVAVFYKTRMSTKVIIQFNYWYFHTIYLMMWNDLMVAHCYSYIYVSDSTVSLTFYTLIQLLLSVCISICI